MICEKCGRKLAPSSEANLSRDLQQYLKSETKALWGKGEVRTVVTTCMDVCPEKQIAIAINFVEPSIERTDFFVAEPEDVSRMADRIIEKLKSK